MLYLALKMLFLNWTRLDNTILIALPIFLLHSEEARLPTFYISEQKGGNQNTTVVVKKAVAEMQFHQLGCCIPVHLQTVRFKNYLDFKNWFQYAPCSKAY